MPRAAARKLRRWLAAFAFAACAPVSSAQTDAPAETGQMVERRARLEQLRAAMAELSEELAQDVEAQSSLRAALRESEIAIGEIRREMNATRRKLEGVRKRLESLRAQRQGLFEARERQREMITREIRTAYLLGRQGRVKVLLNQEQPDTLARVMTYYHYFHAARQARIEHYLHIIRGIDLLEPEITETAERLELARETLAEQEQLFIARKEERERDLSQLEASIAGKDRQLRTMAQDQAELERLLGMVGRAAAELDLPRSELIGDFGEVEDFPALKGAMPWPVAGRPANQFGGRRGEGQQSWQGLNIPAREGSEVAAIHHGRVVFADWFRGSGLLLIIDHGAGYMSLYGHNQALLREVGEWVRAGEPVAIVGNSGGRREAALYFEIRHEGKPVNPRAWLAAAR